MKTSTVAAQRGSGARGPPRDMIHCHGTTTCRGMGRLQTTQIKLNHTGRTSAPMQPASWSWVGRAARLVLVGRPCSPPRGSAVQPASCLLQNIFKFSFFFPITLDVSKFNFKSSTWQTETKNIYKIKSMNSCKKRAKNETKL